MKFTDKVSIFNMFSEYGESVVSCIFSPIMSILDRCRNEKNEARPLELTN